MPKKLKVVVRSLYSHEIRKDVSLESLQSLKLEDAWPFIRDEIEIEIGSSQLVCIPHITEADLYNVTSLFVPNEKETNGKMFTPLGELVKNINKDKSNADYVQWLEEGKFQDDQFQFPHESVKITLQDEAIKNKVRVIMINFSRSTVAKDKDLVNNIYLDIENNKDLKGKKSVYMITSVLIAKTIEFRVTRGTSSRIFHLGNASPLVFQLEEFLIGEDGKLTAKAWARVVDLKNVLKMRSLRAAHGLSFKDSMTVVDEVITKIAPGSHFSRDLAASRNQIQGSSVEKDGLIGPSIHPRQVS